MEPERAEIAEIAEAVRNELELVAVRGALNLRGNTLELDTGTERVSVEVGPIEKQWFVLPLEMRKRKAQEIARRLVQARERVKDQTTGMKAANGEALRVPRAVFVLLGILAAAGIAKLLAAKLLAPKAVSALPSEDIERRERLSRVCEAVRDRMYQGAGFGAFAMEGWTVELWLSSRRASVADHPALRSQIVEGKLTEAADPVLAAVRDGTVSIEDGLTGDAKAKSPSWSAATLVFHEGYARAFFEPEGRARFLRLADRLVDSSGADLGALYGRCAHLTTHDVGAWFYGRDPALASSALVYTMGFFAESPLLRRSRIGAQAAGGELDGLNAAAVGMTADALLPLVSVHGATIGTARGVTLSFPLAGPTRSIAATRDVAAKMNIGVSSH